MEKQPDITTAAERQFVLFELAGETFGVDTANVREIIRLGTITRVPNAPGHIVGVINLRGRIVPVADLRERLGFAKGNATKESRIVVVEVEQDDIGLMVDAVMEVRRVAASAIEPASHTLVAAEAYYLGIANAGDKLVVLLDIEKVLQNIGAVDEAA